MTIHTDTARLSQLQSHSQPAVARSRPQRVNLLSLAQEMHGDPQLDRALRVPGTALLGVATDHVPLLVRLASPDAANVLVSGIKHSGKTELIRTLLASITLFQPARDIQVLIASPDGKPFEFLFPYSHLLGDIATTPERGLQHLRWLENELDRRENERVARPHLVVIVDEIAEFLTSGSREFQVHLGRIAQRGRPLGVSLIVSGTRANASDLNPSLRSNFPVRLIGKNASGNDGADKLAGRGDFILMAGGERVRFQAAYLAPEDVNEFHTLCHRSSTSPQTPPSGLGGVVQRLLGSLVRDQG